MRVRVINLGLPKSGTTSFAEAMIAAGCNVADHRIRKGQTADPALWRNFVGLAMYRGYFADGDPLRDLAEFDAISEVSFLNGDRTAWPQMDFALIEAIRRLHPQVKFVATRRDGAALAGSMMRWTNMGKRLPVANLPGLPNGFGTTEAQLARWIDGHYDALSRVLGPSGAYLELDVAAPDAQAQLSQFLGMALPWWGRANENTRRPQAEAADGNGDETTA